MVLGAAEQDGLLAVAQGEEGALLPVHELLDHDAGPGGAEAAAQHALDLGFGVGTVGADGHALAGGQTVGLDDIGRLEHVQSGLGVLDRVIDAVAGGGDFVAFQEGLGEGLGHLQLGRLGGGAEARDAGRRQTVGETGGQGDFRPDHDEVRLDLAGQGGEALRVVGLDRTELAQLLDARIAGGGDEAGDQRRLGDLPGQGVFTPARSDEKNNHEVGNDGPASGGQASAGLKRQNRAESM